MNVKLAVIGSRDFNDYELVCKTIKEHKFEPILIVSGGAKGADSLGERYADDNNIPKKIFQAEWDNLDAEPCKIKTNKQGKKYNVLAGFNRNKSIVDEADMILAFWDGKSSGTENSIEYAEQKGKFIVTIYYKNIL